MNLKKDKISETPCTYPICLVDSSVRINDMILVLGKPIFCITQKDSNPCPELARQFVSRLHFNFLGFPY
jgi:hypothetical protein